MNSERTNSRNRFAIRLVLLVLIAVMLLTLAVAVQPSQAQSNPTLVVDMSGLNHFVNIHSVLYPRAGNLSYLCPNELLCDRTGSQEWFKASNTDTDFIIRTYGGAIIWGIEGYQLYTDYNVSQDPDGSSFVTFTEEIQAGTDLLIHIRSITAIAEYGVR